MRSWIVPPRCALCAGLGPPRSPLCGECAGALASLAPLITATGALPIAAAHHYEGAARDLIAAIKLGRRAALIPLAAAGVAERAWPRLGAEIAAGAALVPVPADPLRGALRGFDLPLAIARELSRREGLEVVPCLHRRHGARQVGRPRSERLSDPPRVRVRGRAPSLAVIVDDVATTGATLAACAEVLAAAGSHPLGAVVFAAVLGPQRLNSLRRGERGPTVERPTLQDEGGRRADRDQRSERGGHG